MRSRIAAVWVIAVLLCTASLSAAVIRTWPGAAPCDATLQACITGSGAGDSIQIATSTPVAETLTIDKSLTLGPATGYLPVISGNIYMEGTSTATTITVQHLSVSGAIRAFPGTGDLTVHILDNGVTIASSYGIGIEVSSGTSPPYGNLTTEISRNTVNVTGNGVGDQCAGIMVGPTFDSGTHHAVIIGNRVNVINCGQGNALVAYNGNGEAMTVDIIGNRVNATGTNDGIEIRNFQQVAGSTLTGRIINNTVTGQLHEAGFPGAIVISADGYEPISAYVLNNTVAFNNGGIGVSARTDLGASITGVIANNIIANNAGTKYPGYGLSIDADSSATISNSNNLVFNNAADEFTPGPGTVTLDPKFLATTNFHVAPTSPAINAGANVQVPGDITTDLDGTARIKSGTVDIGAFEMPTGRSDFTGEGMSDIILRNSSSGQIAEYQMNGPTVVGAAVVGSPGTAYSVKTIGDYNGDGKADLALQNSTTNDVAVWLMNGNSILSGVLAGNPGANWQLVGSGDFNGDGKSDLVLYNTSSGNVAVWLMNGGTITSGVVLGTPGSAYRFVTAADFNGDGKADVLLQNNTTGDMAVWLMDGVSITGGLVIGGAGPDWRATGAADTNGDGNGDIFLQSLTTGNIALWQMNGFSILSGVIVGSPGATYAMAGVADYNGDGKADILLQNTSGNVVVWILNGGSIVSGTVVSMPGSSWVVNDN